MLSVTGVWKYTWRLRGRGRVKIKIQSLATMLYQQLVNAITATLAGARYCISIITYRGGSAGMWRPLLLLGGVT